MTDKATPVQAVIDPLVAGLEEPIWEPADQRRGELVLVTEIARKDMREAAALLRSQAERIAALEVERDSWKEAALSDDATAVDLLKAAKADLAEAREALEEIAALKAPPTLGDGIFAITSARATLSRLKPGEKGGA